MSSLAHPYITEEQYLEIELKAEYKSEYFRGQMYAMAGGRPAHNRLGFRLPLVLGAEIERRGCLGFNSDQRILTPTRLHAYPDLSVVCGKLEVDRTHALLNPILIVEVLSPSTENYDRSLKFHEYATIQTLRDYVLIGSQVVSVELYSRQQDGAWRITKAEGLEASIAIPSIGATLSLRDLYDGIELTGS